MTDITPLLRRSWKFALHGWVCHLRWLQFYHCTTCRRFYGGTQEMHGGSNRKIISMRPCIINPYSLHCFMKLYHGVCSFQPLDPTVCLSSARFASPETNQIQHVREIFGTVIAPVFGGFIIPNISGQSPVDGLFLPVNYS